MENIVESLLDALIATNTSGTEPNKSEPNKSEPNKSEPNKSKPNKSEPNKSEPNKLGRTFYPGAGCDNMSVFIVVWKHSNQPTIL